MSTEAQILANRRNALNSTGPRTPEGKAISSANSTKHGLSAGFRVLDNENQEEFDELIAEYHRTFKPANTHERFLVEEMVQARWRLARVRRLEAEVIEDMVAHRGSRDADAMMVAAFRNDTASAFTSLQRYASAIERAAFRALDQFLALRKLEARTARDAARRNEPNLTPEVTPPTQTNRAGNVVPAWPDRDPAGDRCQEAPTN
ncbi:MAG: hypothetical protein ABSH47_13630 [Bryobacteraceae bacterium]|jgi:hypothetical protein